MPISPFPGEPVIQNVSSACHPADVNQDGKVNGFDQLAILARLFRRADRYPHADVNSDGKINWADYAQIRLFRGTEQACEAN